MGRKDTVYGYIRQMTNDDIPNDIIHLCILFYAALDRFDRQHISSKLTLNEYDQSVKRNQAGGSANIYFENIVESGRHEWKFKIVRCQNHSGGYMIGLWKVQPNVAPPLDNFFAMGKEKGYGYSISDGKKSRLFDGCSAEQYGKRCNDGDIVEMIVDFDSLSLSFKVNGKDQGKSHDLYKDDKYRAAVYMWYAGD